MRHCVLLFQLYHSLLVTKTTASLFSSEPPCDSVVFSPAGPEIRAELVADTGAQSSPLLFYLLFGLITPMLFQNVSLNQTGHSSLIF